MQIGRVGNEASGFAVCQAIFKGIGSKKGKQRYGDTADFIGCNMCNGGFRALGKQNAHAVSCIETGRFQCIGKLIGKPLQLPEGVFFNLPFFIFINQRQPVPLMGMFVADIDTDVVVFGDVPAE